MTNFENCEKPVSESDLANVEQSIGHRLPPDMRSHYLTWNGGRPKQDTFYGDEGEGDTIAHMYPIKYCLKNNNSPHSLLDGHYIYMRQKDVIPAHILPFASDWGGNFFCVNLRSSEVLFYATDAFSSDRTTEQNFEYAQRYLAPSFAEFINSLEDGEI